RHLHHRPCGSGDFVPPRFGGVTMEGDPLSALASRYQGGERRCLGELYAALHVTIEGALRTQARRALPTCLALEDLRQESCVILAELAQRWDSRRGTFGAYFHRAFPWALSRYVHHHGRRGRRVQEVMMAHDLLLATL